jgi:hypothetical protein
LHVGERRVHSPSIARAGRVKVSRSSVRFKPNCSRSSCAADWPFRVQAVSKPTDFASLRDSATPLLAERPHLQNLPATPARFPPVRRPD